MTPLTIINVKELELLLLIGGTTTQDIELITETMANIDNKFQIKKNPS